MTSSTKPASGARSPSCLQIQTSQTKVWHFWKGHKANQTNIQKVGFLCSFLLTLQLPGKRPCEPHPHPSIPKDESLKVRRVTVLPPRSTALAPFPQGVGYGQVQSLNWSQSLQRSFAPPQEALGPHWACPMAWVLGSPQGSCPHPRMGRALSRGGFPHWDARGAQRRGSRSAAGCWVTKLAGARKLSLVLPTPTPLGRVSRRSSPFPARQSRAQHVMGRNKNKHFPFPGRQGHPHSVRAVEQPCADQPPLLQRAPRPWASARDPHPGPPTGVVAFSLAHRALAPTFQIWWTSGMPVGGRGRTCMSAAQPRYPAPGWSGGRCGSRARAVPTGICGASSSAPEFPPPSLTAASLALWSSPPSAWESWQSLPPARSFFFFPWAPPQNFSSSGSSGWDYCRARRAQSEWVNGSLSTSAQRSAGPNAAPLGAAFFDPLLLNGLNAPREGWEV